MFSKDTLVNIAVFLERVPSIPPGKDAYAWVETHQAVMAEIKKIEDATKGETK